MSKLLGTASTNDEQEEDFDGDEDETNERRKEELDDAEFGIVNDRPNSALDGGSVGGDSAEVNRLTENAGGHSPAPESRDSDSSIGSGSTDNEAPIRQVQQQQRADLEFYGHPGEESRHLKYGILGSGNYEVVNGGIYAGADESTAAVNSVANYVRRPGVLLAGLSKLAVGPSNDDHHSHSHDGPQAAAYMPGGRIVGHMRGASNHPDDLVGFVPITGAPGDLVAAPKGLHSPLLDLIDANGGHLFDPNLVAQLGSSGSSARTTHEEAPNEDEHSNNLPGRKLKKGDLQREEHYANHQKESNEFSARKWRGKKQKHANTKTKTTDYEEERDQQTSNSKLPPSRSKQPPSDQSTVSGSGGKSQGTNQFYSYQILPSKKVTIFSDQDLDSAPSERNESLRLTKSPIRRSQ